MATFDVDDRGIVVPCPTCGRKNRLAFGRLGESVRCGECKHELSPPASPIEMRSSADFDRLVAASSIPVVVDYWAPWCGPCRMVAPEIEKVAARNAGRLLVVKVNTDALTDLGERFGFDRFRRWRCSPGAGKSRGLPAPDRPARSKPSSPTPRRSRNGSRAESAPRGSVGVADQDEAGPERGILGGTSASIPSDLTHRQRYDSGTR
jgi:thioredoxin 2